MLPSAEAADDPEGRDGEIGTPYVQIPVLSGRPVPLSERDQRGRDVRDHRTLQPGTAR